MQPGMIQNMAKGALGQIPNYVMGNVPLVFTGGFAAYAFYVFWASWSVHGLFSFGTIYICLALYVSRTVCVASGAWFEAKALPVVYQKTGLAPKPSSSTALSSSGGPGSQGTGTGADSDEKLSKPTLD